jgi:hypothetical protein
MRFFEQQSKSLRIGNRRAKRRNAVRIRIHPDHISAVIGELHRNRFGRFLPKRQPSIVGHLNFPERLILDFPDIF